MRLLTVFSVMLAVGYTPAAQADERPRFEMQGISLTMSSPRHHAGDPFTTLVYLQGWLTDHVSGELSNCRMTAEIIPPGGEIPPQTRINASCTPFNATLPLVAEEAGSFAFYPHAGVGGGRNTTPDEVADGATPTFNVNPTNLLGYFIVNQKTGAVQGCLYPPDGGSWRCEIARGKVVSEAQDNPPSPADPDIQIITPVPAEAID